RCFLVVDSKERAVGTISAWSNPAYRGQDYGRIHWVALRPSHQHKGLARPALAFALRRLALWHTRCYLVTQVTRLPAIKLYLDFGFQPDLSDQRLERLWCYLRDRLKHPALATLRPGSV
ncbi:MAG: GNAT family N-acetyltransferase, partial [Planctomycetota bacterium]|nr:GNAT family N-acetyltransferase [Planctomycetota bacterium]